MSIIQTQAVVDKRRNCVPTHTQHYITMGEVRSVSVLCSPGLLLTIDWLTVVGWIAMMTIIIRY